jgi:hypothetical protein
MCRSVGEKKAMSKGGGRVIFESSEEIVLPIEDAKYVLECDGVKWWGRPGGRGITASFTISFKTEFFFEYEYSVVVQFVGKRHIFVFFKYADLYQVYSWLTSTFGTKLRLKSFELRHDLLRMWKDWTFSDFYLMQLVEHNTSETLSFIHDHLAELITITSLSKIPREFGDEWPLRHNKDRKPTYARPRRSFA